MRRRKPCDSFMGDDDLWHLKPLADKRHVSSTFGDRIPGIIGAGSLARIFLAANRNRPSLVNWTETTASMLGLATRSSGAAINPHFGKMVLYAKSAPPGTGSASSGRGSSVESSRVRRVVRQGAAARSMSSSGNIASSTVSETRPAVVMFLVWRRVSGCILVAGAHQRA